MNDDFASPAMAGLTAGLEFAVLRVSFAPLSAYALYGQFLGEDLDGGRLLDVGYSVGAKMYLKKIAFPAFALALSHNLSRRRAKFTVAFNAGF